MAELSVFRNVSPASFVGNFATEDIVNMIRTDKFKQQTDYLRTITDEVLARNVKAGRREEGRLVEPGQFWGVTWSGTFLGGKKSSDLLQHSQLICVDIDKLAPGRLHELREVLRADSFTNILFISPSGNGLKIVIKIDYKDPGDHKRFFQQIHDYYIYHYRVQEYEFDSSCKNVDRLCFIPHDPGIYFNPDSTIMALEERYLTDDPPLVQKVKAADKRDFSVGLVRSPAQYLDRSLDMIRRAPDGQKHYVLCKAGKLAGGYIASGLVQENEAVLALEEAIRVKPNVIDFEAARRTIRDSIDYGRNKPIEPYVPFLTETSSVVQVPDDWPNPLPLQKEWLPVTSLEPDMIPSVLRMWVFDIADRMKCPPDYPATAAIVMISALIGTRLTIKPKQKDDWIVVPNLWGAAIGRPSAKKTPPVKEVFRPLFRLEKEADQQYQEAVSCYEAERIATEEQLKLYKQQQADLLRGKSVSNQVAYPEPAKPPAERRLIVYDATVEKLGEILSENLAGLLVYRDELTGLLASWSRRGHEADRAFYLSAWDGSTPNRDDRISRKGHYIENVCLALYGTIQPAKLLTYLQAATTSENDGFVQRLQVAVLPDRPIWAYTDEYPDRAASNQAYNLIQKLVESDISVMGFQPDEYNNFAYTRFDDVAQEIFREWLTDLETNIIPGESGLLEEHFSKYSSLMPSLALIFHLIECLDEGKQSKHISAEAARMATQWCDYLASHARRIYGLLETAPIAGANRILREIRSGNLTDGFKTRDVVRMRWSYLTTTAEVDASINELIRANWLYAEDPPSRQEPWGRPEAVRYRIHPHLLQNA
ncbi:DUF3987 domain-containing protein [Fibrella aquatica]|uniref:DUF3987 domain-containing protein n=1 Tax=Fibrella aquatica TaxID=3242487 RepID=UPI0035207922